MDTLSNSVQTIRILIMKIFNQFSSWIQYPVGGKFIDQVNRFTQKHLSMDSKQLVVSFERSFFFLFKKFYLDRLYT